MKKNLVILTTVLIMLVSLFSMPVLADNSSDEIEIGVTVMTMRESVRHFMKTGAMKEAKKHGVEVTWQSGENSLSTQMAQIENYISQDIDVIVFEPARADGSTALAARIEASGKPWINVEQPIPGGSPDLRITADNYEIGKLQAETFVKKYGDKPAKIVILSGSPGNSAAANITQGVLDVLDNYSQYEVVLQREHQNWDRQLAMNTMEDTLIEYDGEIDAVIANNDTMALGAMRAAINAGVEEDILFIGSDFDRESAELLLDGKENYFVVDRGSILQGHNIVKAAVALAKGEEPPYDVIDDEGRPFWKTAITMVSKDNVVEMCGEKYPDLLSE